MMTRQQAMAAIEELGRRRQQFGLSAAETIELSEAYRAVGLVEQADELRPRQVADGPHRDAASIFPDNGSHRSTLHKIFFTPLWSIEVEWVMRRVGAVVIGVVVIACLAAGRAEDQRRRTEPQQYVTLGWPTSREAHDWCVRLNREFDNPRYPYPIVAKPDIYSGWVLGIDLVVYAEPSQEYAEHLATTYAKRWSDGHPHHTAGLTVNVFRYDRTTPLASARARAR